MCRWCDSVSSNVERMMRERPPSLHSPSYVVKPAITISIHYNHLAFQWGFVVLVEPWGALVQPGGLGVTYLQGLLQLVVCSPSCATFAIKEMEPVMELKALANQTPLQVVWELGLQESCRELFYTVKIPTLNYLLIYHFSIYVLKNL